MSKREIFMRNGSYQMCQILFYGGKNYIENKIIVCKTDRGRIFAAEQMMGTWGECQDYCNDVTELHYENDLPRSMESGEDFYEPFVYSMSEYDYY